MNNQCTVKDIGTQAGFEGQANAKWLETDSEERGGGQKEEGKSTDNESEESK